eukprot:368647_1
MLLYRNSSLPGSFEEKSTTNGYNGFSKNVYNASKSSPDGRVFGNLDAAESLLKASEMSSPTHSSGNESSSRQHGSLKFNGVKGLSFVHNAPGNQAHTLSIPRKSTRAPRNQSGVMVHGVILETKPLSLCSGLVDDSTTTVSDDEPWSSSEGEAEDIESNATGLSGMHLLLEAGILPSPPRPPSRQRTARRPARGSRRYARPQGTRRPRTRAARSEKGSISSFSSFSGEELTVEQPQATMGELGRQLYNTRKLSSETAASYEHKHEDSILNPRPEPILPPASITNNIGGYNYRLPPQNQLEGARGQLPLPDVYIPNFPAPTIRLPTPPPLTDIPSLDGKAHIPPPPSALPTPQPLQPGRPGIDFPSLRPRPNRAMPASVGPRLVANNTTSQSATHMATSAGSIPLLATIPQTGMNSGSQLSSGNAGPGGMALGVMSPGRLHTWICYQCQLQCPTRADLEAHMRSTGHGTQSLNIDRFICDLCGKEFHKKQNLRVHLRIHSNMRPYSCPHCQKRFSRKGNMIRHILTHTNVRPYHCKYCTKTFNDPSNLKKHMKNRHLFQGNPQNSMGDCEYTLSNDFGVV